MFVQGSEEVKRYACPPLPPYVDELELLSLDEEMDETESKIHSMTSAFHLLKLYSDRFVMASSFFADFFINDAVHSCVFMQADFKFSPLFRHYSLQQLLDPSTVTADHLDYRLSWHLWNVLQALNYNHCPPHARACCMSAMLPSWRVRDYGTWQSSCCCTYLILGKCSVQSTQSLIGLG